MNTTPQSLLLIGIALTIIPLALAVGTSYVKISIVLGVLRQGLGTQQAPNNLVITALSCALSAIIMRPVLDDVWKDVSQLKPAHLEKQNAGELVSTLGKSLEPWKAFLKLHAGERELATVRRLAARNPEPPTPDPVDSIATIVTAFLLTELKEAFCMGFILLVPFLVIDLVVANVVVGLGLTMVNPTMVTLPLKLLLFFCADGWLAISRGLVRSYGVGV